MEELSDEVSLEMANFHNAVVVLVDTCKIPPPEAVMVLRMMANEIEAVFAMKVRGG